MHEQRLSLHIVGISGFLGKDSSHSERFIRDSHVVRGVIVRGARARVPLVKDGHSAAGGKREKPAETHINNKNNKEKGLHLFSAPSAEEAAEMARMTSLFTAASALS